jgi:hypothetical protein
VAAGLRQLADSAEAYRRPTSTKLF